MHVEECCHNLLKYILPIVDIKKKGLCIDVGVGTFALYCELFARNGFETIAVEPLPTPAVKKTCRSLGINLIKACLYDNDGTIDIYTGTFNGSDDLNLSSVRPDWWGSSSKSVAVRTITVDSLLKSVKANSITCLKLDVEGVESVIIKQLQNVPKTLLPEVVVFEYGGGGTRAEGKGGWSDIGILETVCCFNILKDLTYRTVILVDSLPDSMEKVFDLSEHDISPDAIFYPQAVYGNAICFRNCIMDVSWVNGICTHYRNNQSHPPAPMPDIGFWERLKWRLISAVRKMSK